MHRLRREEAKEMHRARKEEERKKEREERQRKEEAKEIFYLINSDQLDVRLSGLGLHPHHIEELKHMDFLLFEMHYNNIDGTLDGYKKLEVLADRCKTGQLENTQFSSNLAYLYGVVPEFMDGGLSRLMNASQSTGSAPDERLTGG